MTYETIDPSFRAWAKKHELEVLTRYHETDVRTVFVQGTDPERGQIWIDPPNPNGIYVVHAAVYRKRGRDNQQTDISATADRVEAVLDEAYATLVGWLGVPS